MNWIIFDTVHRRHKHLNWQSEGEQQNQSNPSLISHCALWLAANTNGKAQINWPQKPHHVFLGSAVDFVSLRVSGSESNTSKSRAKQWHPCMCNTAVHREKHFSSHHLSSPLDLFNFRKWLNYFSGTYFEEEKELVSIPEAGGKHMWSQMAAAGRDHYAARTLEFENVVTSM